MLYVEGFNKAGTGFSPRESDCMNAFLLAANIVLTPFDIYLGEIPAIEICDFSFAPETVLTAGTSIMVAPYRVTYGPGSTVSLESGMECGPCAVYEIKQFDDGTTVLYCEKAI